MADQPIEPGKYDAKQTPERNAASDAATVKTTFENEGAEKAYASLQKELDPKALQASGATPEQQRAYQEAMVKELQASGVLPEISIAHALKNKDAVMKDGVVDSEKLGAAQYYAKNPVDRELYKQFGDKYDALKKSAGGYDVGEPTLRNQLKDNADAAKERVAGAQKQAADRTNLGTLVTDPKLFDGIAGKDGVITKDDATEFQKKFMAPGSKGDQFREQFGGKTPEGQEQVRKTVDSVVKAFDDPRNQDDKKGSVLKENHWSVVNWSTEGDRMTKDSLAKGMGYKDAAEAAKKLPTDIGKVAVTPPVVDAGKDQKPPVVEVKPPTALDLSNTALKRNEGPWHVAGQMMAGEKFNDPGKVREDLKNAIRTVFNDKEKAQQITPENLGKVREAVTKSGNEELTKWFDSKYPKTAEKAAVAVPPAAEVKVEPAKDFSDSKLPRGKGSDAVARKMTEGQNLSEGATKALQKVIASGFTDKEGAEQVNAANLEDVRKKVEASQNPELTTWFNKRYPKPTDRR